MAGFTPDSFVHMDAVIEISEICQVVYPHPRYRFTGSPALPDWFQDWAIGPDLAVAGHTGVSGRDICKGRFFDSHMTIPAVEAQVCHVLPVAERNRLFDGYINLSGKWRAEELEQDQSETRDDEYRSKDTCLGESVNAWMKYLRHSPPLLFQLNQAWLVYDENWHLSIIPTAIPLPSLFD